MNDRYCPECGTEMHERELELEGAIPYCPTCEAYRFPRYNVAVSMIVVDESTGRILLLQQYGKPHWILVAGYVTKGEALENAVVREIREETGLTVSRFHFNRTRYYEPSGTLMCNFTAFVADASELCTNHEVDAYRWFDPEDARANIKADVAKWFLESYLDSL